MSKYILLYCIMISLIYNCVPEPEDIPPTLKPYNSEKAGAEIVKSYDLSSIYNPNQIDSYLHFSEYNNKFYIIHNEMIHIFDKNTMIKENNEIIFDITYFYPGFSEYNEDCYYNYDIAVNDNKILFSYTLRIKTLNIPNKGVIFDMDLSGDNFRELDVSSDFGFDGTFSLLGYNIIEENIWIPSYHEEEMSIYINEYYYDITNDYYIKKDKWDYTPIWRGDGLCLYGDIVWLSYALGFPTGEVYIEERDKNNPTEVLKKIDVNYLGTLSSPEDIHYDGEYLWIIIEKDGKMQLLKLKPL